MPGGPSSSAGGMSGSSATSESGGVLGFGVSGLGAGSAVGSVVGNGLGVIPPPNATPWLPVLASVSSTMGGMVVPPVSQSAITTTWASTHSVVSPLVTVPGVSQLCTPAVASVVPAGSFMAEGLLPVPDKLAQKIIRLEFVEMRELMPEMWMGEEEETSRNILTWPRRKVGPVTSIVSSALSLVLYLVHKVCWPKFEKSC